MGNRLYVGNLSFKTTKETVATAFGAIGEVRDVHIATDRETGQPRGFGFVTMATDEAAQNAIAQLNGSLLDGRPLRVNEAQERPPRGGGGGFGGGGGTTTTTTSDGGGGTMVQPVCGNGILEGTEPCDDGNLDNGDACSKTCAITEFDVMVDPTVGNEWPGIGTSGVDNGKGFFVVWRYRGSEADPNDDQIRGRGVTAAGALVGASPVQLSTTPGPGQARIGTNAAGRSIVAWQSYGGGESGVVRYRVVEPDGTVPGAADSKVTNPGPADATADNLISVGASPTGEFALLWTDFDGTSTNAKVRCFNDSGSLFNTATQTLGLASTTGDYPGIWGSKNGMIASWATSGGNLGSVALDSLCVPVGAPFQLATGGSDADPNQNPFGAYVGPNDEFVAVYEHPVDVGTGLKNRIYRRRFQAPGQSVETGVVVSNTDTYEYNSRVARFTNGNFVVVWAANDPATSCDIHARVFKGDGTPKGPETTINQVNTDCQSWPGVAVNSDGDAMFVWDNNIFSVPIPYHISAVIVPRMLAD